MNDVQNLKRNNREISGDVCFKLHKWHSNSPELESRETMESINYEEPSYAKQQVHPSVSGECSLLGLKWDHDKCTLSITFPHEDVEPTKTRVLRKLAKVHDSLGLVSPVIHEGKMMCRDVCDLKLAWDAPLPDTLSKQWKK